MGGRNALRSHVIKLLKQPVRKRRMMSVALDADQYELVEKLSLFLSREVGNSVSKNQVVEEAVRAFVIESVSYIAEEFDMDIYNTTLTELRDYKRISTIDVGALDTVVLPVRDDEDCRKLLFEQWRWTPVQLEGEKLRNLKFAAFCFGHPTGAITHYAAVKSYASLQEDPRKKILHFTPPEALGHPLEWRETGRLRRPRYTAFAMLMEAKSIEELFGQ